MKRLHEARLEGLVEVGVSMSSLSNQARLDVARECNDLVYGPNANTPSQYTHVLTVLPSLPSTPTAVIFLKKESMQIFFDDEMVTEHKITGVSVMAVVNIEAGTVVFVGNCQKNKKRLAVVLNFFSSGAAEGFINAFKEVQQNAPTVRLYSTPEPATAASQTPAPVSCSLPPQLSDPQPPPPPAQSLPPTSVYSRPLPQPPTAEPTVERSQMLNRPLPPLPTEAPSSGPLYDEIAQYKNPNYSGVPPPLPLKYENVQELKGATSLPVKEPFYEVDDWSEGDDDNVYEKANKYYQTLGFDQEECEQLYMTAEEIDELRQQYQPGKTEGPNKEQIITPSEVEIKEADSDTSDHSDVEGVGEIEEDEEPLKSSTLEEDVQSFIKGEFQFKNAIWRIREAKPSLTPDLRHLLKGTETLADIHNDMYVELYEGYKSCSKIAEVFLSRKDQLERYKYYLLNSHKLHKLLQEQDLQVRKRFPKLHKDIQESWKRLYFYLASMEKMLATAPPSERPLLKTVVDQLKEMNRDGDSTVIIEAVHGAPFNLANFLPLLLHSSFLVRNEQLMDKQSVCHLMLFQDYLVLTTPAEDGYQYLHRLPLSGIKLLPSKRDNKKCFVLETRCGEKFGIRAATDKKIQLWRQRLTDLIIE